MATDKPMRTAAYLLSFTLAALVVALGWLPAPAGSQSIDELRRQQQQTEQRKEQIQRRLREIKNNQREMSSVVRSLDTRVNRLDSEITKLASKIEQLGEERDELKQELEELQQENDSLRERFNRRAVSIYLNSQISTLELLLRADSLDELMQSLFYSQVMMQRDQRLANRVRGARQAVETQKARLDQKYMELRESKAKLDERKQELNNQLAVKRQLKREIDQDRVLWERKIAALKAESRKIEEELKEMIRQNGGYGGEWSGSFLKPVRGRITSSFGHRTPPIPGASSYHPGIDFGAPRGAPVRAAEAGRVVFSGYRGGGYGYVVMVDHGTDSQGRSVVTLYAHNSRLLVSKGETVSRGQQIAKVGSTGNSTGPHAHFEVRLNGSPTDPQNYDM